MADRCGRIVFCFTNCPHPVHDDSTGLVSEKNKLRSKGLLISMLPLKKYNPSPQRFKGSWESRMPPVLFHYLVRRKAMESRCPSRPHIPSKNADFCIEPKTNEVYDLIHFIRFARPCGGRAVSRVLTNAATDKAGNPSERDAAQRQTGAPRKLVHVAVAGGECLIHLCHRRERWSRADRSTPRQAKQAALKKPSALLLRGCVVCGSGPVHGRAGATTSAARPAPRTTA